MLLIYTETVSPRLDYIAEFIFGSVLSVEHRLTTDKENFINSKLPKINYSNEKIGDELFLRSNRLLFSESIENVKLTPIPYNNESGFFETSSDSFLPFDLFCASFYAISRMEEYLPCPRDNHGRFEAKNSFLQKFGLLEKPVVNIWAKMLAGKIAERYPDFKFAQQPFIFLPTIDIDNAWAYHGKGFLRWSGALMRELLNGDFTSMSARFKSLIHIKNDPFHVYPYLFSVFAQNPAAPVFFFLLGDYGKFDKNVPWTNKRFRNLIREINIPYNIGIHPSWLSSAQADSAPIRKEKERLEVIAGEKIDKARQHFLRLQIPDTYRNYLDIGIKCDYTMGYADAIGFRAGTCTPFRFFDLETNQKTDLLIYPFEIMDVTMRQYMNLPPEEAMERIETIMDYVKNCGGVFSYIWHNESLNRQWKDYRKVFEQMNKLGFSYADKPTI